MGEDDIASSSKSKTRSGGNYRKDDMEELAGNYIAFGQVMSVTSKKNKLNKYYSLILKKIHLLIVYTE